MQRSYILQSLVPAIEFSERCIGQLRQGALGRTSPPALQKNDSKQRKAQKRQHKQQQYKQVASRCGGGRPHRRLCKKARAFVAEINFSAVLAAGCTAAAAAA